MYWLGTLPDRAIKQFKKKQIKIKNKDLITYGFIV